MAMVSLAGLRQLAAGLTKPPTGSSTTKVTWPSWGPPTVQLGTVI